MTNRALSIDEGTITVQPVAGRIGALISGIRLAGDLPAEIVATIRSTLLERKAIFFRDQHHLTLSEQEGFARLLGPIIAHPTIKPIAGADVALNIAYEDGSTAANEWHSDETFLEEPPLGAVLHAVTLPSVGGDTLWANCASAYDDLPAPLQRLADDLWIRHSNSSAYNAARRHPNKVSMLYEMAQPLVRVHPETGEKVLMLGFHAQDIVDLPRPDSAQLIALFQRHITRPENTMRWHWRLGDVAVWDNRATQHYGIGDFSEKRVLNRVSIAGDIPVSVTGERTRVLRQEPWIRS